MHSSHYYCLIYLYCPYCSAALALFRHPFWPHAVHLQVSIAVRHVPVPGVSRERGQIILISKIYEAALVSNGRAHQACLPKKHNVAGRSLEYEEYQHMITQLSFEHSNIYQLAISRHVTSTNRSKSSYSWHMCTQYKGAACSTICWYKGSACSTMCWYKGATCSTLSWLKVHQRAEEQNDGWMHMDISNAICPNIIWLKPHYLSYVEAISIRH